MTLVELVEHHILLVAHVQNVLVHWFNSALEIAQFTLDLLNLRLLVLELLGHANLLRCVPNKMKIGQFFWFFAVEAFETTDLDEDFNHGPAMVGFHLRVYVRKGFWEDCNEQVKSHDLNN